MLFFHSQTSVTENTAFHLVSFGALMEKDSNSLHHQPSKYVTFTVTINAPQEIKRSLAW
jgi:hypothetical protein